MSKSRKLKIIVVSVFLFLVSVGLVQGSPAASNQPLTIVISFTILQDFAQNVVGPSGDVRVLSQIGAEVHEWELTPRNFMDLEQADILFYNGLNVEQWMGQVRATVRAGVPIIAVGEECTFPTRPIVTGDYAGYPDPHIWMDPFGAIAYVEVIRDALMEHDPVNADRYRKNADTYIDSLHTLHQQLQDTLETIPEENRTLITTEAAFIYLAGAYGLYHDAVWGTNTEEEGTPQQMMRIMRLVTERNPLGIFWESTGSPRYALSISADTNTPVYGPLYVDSVDSDSSGAETYVKMMQSNAALLVKVLAP